MKGSVVMIPHILNNINHERAEYARDIEYIREMTTTDMLDDNTDHALKLFEDEITTTAEDREVEAMVNMLDDDDSFVEKEIQRIMESTSDSVSLDEVMNIESFI